jgi:ABC transporter substrate binding protein
VIGYLESASQFADLIPAFRNGLSETGFIDGQNVKIEYRWAEGQYDRLPTLTAELVHDHATLIFTTALILAQAAKAVTTTVPIVFVSGPDPVQLGRGELKPAGRQSHWRHHEHGRGKATSAADTLRSLFELIPGEFCYNLSIVIVAR